MTSTAIQAVGIDVGSAILHADLTLPEGARSVVLFAHGSGSGRHSPRNRFVAEHLVDAGMATLLLDLLTEGEDMLDRATGHLRFDIRLLADRLVEATDWLAQNKATANLPVGYFGASTGAGAALVAATHRPRRVHAIVSRGGRPDLAGDALKKVEAPTLLIVGARDLPVIDLNQAGLEQLSAPLRELVIVPGATHLFEEPGTLDEVARLAADWFLRHLDAERR